MSAGRSESPKVGCHDQLSEQNRPTPLLLLNGFKLTQMKKRLGNLKPWKANNRTTWARDKPHMHTDKSDQMSRWQRWPLTWHKIPPLWHLGGRVTFSLVLDGSGSGGVMLCSAQLSGEYAASTPLHASLSAHNCAPILADMFHIKCAHCTTVCMSTPLHASPCAHNCCACAHNPIGLNTIRIAAASTPLHASHSPLMCTQSADMFHVKCTQLFWSTLRFESINMPLYWLPYPITQNV